MKLLIIIPAYNESENIQRVVSNLVDNYPQYDYVVINDGSRDNTAQICRDNNYNLIDIPINIGLAGVFQTGMKYAFENNYDYAVQYDGDGQHNAEYISIMLEEMQSKDLDFVIGSRYVTEKKPRKLRMLGSNLISFIFWVTTGKTIKDPTSGMRMFNKKLIDVLANSSDLGPEPDTLAYLVRAGIRYSEVQVSMNERIAGVSYLTSTRAIKYMAHIIISIVLIQWFRKKPEQKRGKK